MLNLFQGFAAAETYIQAPSFKNFFLARGLNIEQIFKNEVESACFLNLMRTSL
jgi:hypothetical protein